MQGKQNEQEIDNGRRVTTLTPRVPCKH